jgi:hypothetical protein
MPVDFSLLPPEQKVPDAPPSKLVWTAVFFVLTLLGVFAILLLWPKNEPTRTSWFWFCLSVYPVGIAAFVVFRCLSAYEGRLLDAQEWNAARERYIEGVFAKASVPLAVLGVAYRFVDDDKKNNTKAIAQRILVLKAQPSIAEQGTVTARWLNPEALDRSKWRRGPDTARQSQVLKWLFERLIDQLAGELEGLSAELPLTVRLSVVADALEVDPSAIWKGCWRSRGLRSAKVLVELASSGLMVLDTWLDSKDEMVRCHSTLLVIIQLNAILSKNPPDGSAEGGAALLIVPEEIARRYTQKPAAFIHRPMCGTVADLDHTLTYALRWGKSEPMSVGQLWLSGVKTHSLAALHAALSIAGVTARRSEMPPEMNMDRTVGNAGVAAPWLSLACAVASANQSGANQLLIEQRENEIIATIVAPALLQENSQTGAFA